MTTEQLNVQITANASSLKNELSDSEKAVQHLRSALGKIRAATEDPAKGLEKLQTIIDHFKRINTQITIHMDPKWEYLRGYVDEIRGTITELQDVVAGGDVTAVDIDSLPIQEAVDAADEYDATVNELNSDIMDSPTQSRTDAAYWAGISESIGSYQAKLAEVEARIQAIQNILNNTNTQMPANEFVKLEKELERLQAYAEKLKATISELKVPEQPAVPTAPTPQGGGKGGGGDSSSGGGGMLKGMGKIFGAMLGIRSIFMLIKRIASQNEALKAAVDNIINTLAQLLAPLFNFLSGVLNGISDFIRKTFHLTKKVAKSTGSTAKSLASFDEINNIGGKSGGGAATPEETPAQSLGQAWIEFIIAWIKQALVNIITVIEGALAVISTAVLGLLTLIIENVGFVVALVGGTLMGTLSGAFTLALGLFKTVADIISDMATLFKNLFKNFVQGFRDAREKGKTIIGSIFAGLWKSIKGLFKDLWKLIKDLFVNLWNTIKSTISNFVKHFSDTFSKIMTWVNNKLVDPILKAIQKIWNWVSEKVIKRLTDSISDLGGKFVNLINKVILPFTDKIGDGFKKVINGVIRFLNWIIGGINKIPGINVGYISYLANGGFPQVGQLFVANEAGPEMVGMMGHQNVVANNQQIVAGIADGVYSAMMSAMNNSDKDIKIYLDGDLITKKVINGINFQKRVKGVSLV